MDMNADPPLTPPAPDSFINQAESMDYWSNVSADLNGMLGGYSQTSRIDLIGSRAFIAKLRRGKNPYDRTKQLPPLKRAADCGAGVGRITKALLMNIALSVDVVEPVKKFTDELDASLNEEEKEKLGRVMNSGLQDWTPEEGAYDIIWNQWCVGYLTDAQFVEYLRRCKNGLVKPDKDAEGDVRQSWVVVKENITSNIDESDIYDEVDSSVTRSDKSFQKLFKEAGLKIVSQELQKPWVKELFAVKMYALKPE